jgi:DNA-binding transcriptional regulator YiaG
MMSDPKNLLPSAIRELRGARTQTDFAAAVGVEYQGVVRWESGRFQPSEGAKIRLARYAKREGRSDLAEIIYPSIW